MRLTATLAGVAALALAPPAHAGMIAETKVGSFMDDLVVGPDGGAWVFIDRPGRDAVGRAGPDGSFRTAATGEYTLDGVLGPDGNAWFETGPAKFLRADAADTLTTAGDELGDDALQSAMAIGPDGT